MWPHHGNEPSARDGKTLERNTDGFIGSENNNNKKMALRDWLWV